MVSPSKLPLSRAPGGICHPPRCNATRPNAKLPLRSQRSQLSPSLFLDIQHLTTSFYVFARFNRRSNHHHFKLCDKTRDFSRSAYRNLRARLTKFAPTHATRRRRHRQYSLSREDTLAFILRSTWGLEVRQTSITSSTARV